MNARFTFGWMRWFAAFLAGYLAPILAAVAFTAVVVALLITSNASLPTVDAKADTTSLSAPVSHTHAVDVPVHVGSMRFFNGSVAPRGNVDRSDACRNYFLFAHESEAQGETDAIACAAPVVVVVEKKHHEPIVTPAPVVETPVVVVAEDNDTDTPVVVTPEPEAPATPVVHGNPGNDKPVGQTEQCNKGMCENAGGQDGEHGKSNNDSGKGNHDH